MAPDTLLTIGVLLVIMAFPAFFAAFADKRRPYLSLGLFTTAAVLIYLAYQRKPGGYAFDELPDVVVIVFASWVM